MNKKFTALLLLTILTGLLGYFFLYQLLNLPDVLGAHIVGGVILPMIIPAVATMWYILTSLKAFQPGTRIAYYFIALGIFAYALTQIGQLAVNVLNVFLPSLVLSINVSNGIFVVPYIVSTICLYVGVRKLAQLLGIRSWWMSPILALGCAIVLAGASLLIPHTPDSDPSIEHSLQIVFALISATVALGAIATVIAMRIKDIISTTYRGAMTWLVVALGILTLGTVQEVIAKATDLINSGYSTNGLDLIPFLLAGILFMKAGQALKAATFKKLADNATYVDAVVYAAGLVSNPKSIDTTLDTLRRITAGLPGGEAQLKSEDKKVLLGVYRSIESYLLTKEPFLKLDRTSLRARLTPEFQDELSLEEKAA